MQGTIIFCINEEAAEQMRKKIANKRQHNDKKFCLCSEDKGKLSFTVMDVRVISRLFADPECDGSLDIFSDFDPEAQTSMHKCRLRYMIV